MIDYQKIAGDLLFGTRLLDNSMRGNFIEAVVFEALRRYVYPTTDDWHYVGLGWGPWDLQRGRYDTTSRVRFQVKVKAKEQIWTRPNRPPKKAKSEFVLGFRQMERLPDDFSNHYPKEKFGICEHVGYRCDYFLLAWHGPTPSASLADLSAGPQSDPNNYWYFIVPVNLLGLDVSTAKKSLTIDQLLALKVEPLTFCKLPLAMNQACENFLGRSA